MSGTKTASGWTVLGEDPPILVRTYAIGPGNSTNCMAVGIGEGRLAVVSAPTDPPDEALAELEGFGTVAAVVATSGFHRSGLPHWKERMPDVPVYAPTRALDKVRAVSPKARDLEELEVTGPAQLLALQGARFGDTWVVAPGRDGLIWYVADTITNMKRLPGPPLGWFMRLVGIQAGFALNRAQLRLFTVDKPGRSAWLRQRLADGAPTMVVPAHGAHADMPDLGARLDRMFA